jgi:hypothetical protein
VSGRPGEASAPCADDHRRAGRFSALAREGAVERAAEAAFGWLVAGAGRSDFNRKV